MKDLNGKIMPKETIYKDVVIIGNGPSGIALSYMLAGNWPYWDPEKISMHQDDLLRARLNFADHTKSLVEQNLLTLAEGLEGRSTNPVSLLLDSLQNPSADLGAEIPSMLQYKCNKNKQIDHVVLGKGKPGGSWHRMDPNLRTLSLSTWMSLPGLDFHTWDIMNETKLKEIALNAQQEEQQKQNHESQKQSVNYQSNNNSDSNNNNKIVESNNNNNYNNEKLMIKNTNLSPIINVPRRNLSVKRLVSKEVQTRALVSRVAEYYENYVIEMNLSKYFVSNTIVESIQPIGIGGGGAGGGGGGGGVCCSTKENHRFKDARWLVYGINKTTNKAFSYACKNIVLANGASDLANKLGLHSENLGFSWVKYELPQLESVLKKLTDAERKNLKPVLIVGAGLSAADAVTICRSSDVHVIHVYRSRTAGLDKMLPKTVYPEYNEVHEMMKDSKNTYDLYTPLPEHTIIDLSQSSTSPGGHKVTVKHLKTGEINQLNVSYCVVLIGSRPDLRFISPSILSSKSDDTIKNNNCNNNNNNNQIKKDCLALENNYNNSILEHQFTLITRRINWLKNLCAKCKHINICEWSRRNGYKKICGHTMTRNCECPKVCHQQQQQMNTTNILHNNSLDDGSFIGIGEDPTKPIDCKTNQILVDKYTNQVIRAPKGLYAMGPLVGDNFVRFISGGALAITSALHKEND